MSKIKAKTEIEIVHTFQTYVEHKIPGVGLFQGGDGHTDVKFACIKAINRYYGGTDDCPREVTEAHKEANRLLHAHQRTKAIGVVYSDGTVRIMPVP